jgi:hypothetical protein
MANGQGDWVDVPAQSSQGDWVDVSPAAKPKPSAQPISDSSTIGPGKKASLLSFDPHKLVVPPGAGIGGSPIGNPFDINTTGIENYTQQGRKEHPVLSRAGDLTAGVKELLFGGQRAGKPIGTTSGVADNPVTTAISLAPAAAEFGARLTEAAPNLARINKILGVSAREVRVGALPESLDEFASNPARGVVKSGLNEKQLAKMNPLERLKTITETRNAAGTKLDQVLNANADKTINVQKVVEDTFGKFADDKKLTKLAESRFQQVLSRAKIGNKPLSQLAPMEARTIQRELDEFADFAPEGSAQTFRNVATQLRRGISAATRKAIPETAELDQDYGDLAGATKAARKKANEYARTVPQSKLRRIVPYLITGGAAALGAEGVSKYVLPAVPH